MALNALLAAASLGVSCRHSKRGNRREARVACTHTACTIGGVMQPGAGTTVERQVAGEFGDRSPVLNQTKPKPKTLRSACQTYL